MISSGYVVRVCAVLCFAAAAVAVSAWAEEGASFFELPDSPAAGGRLFMDKGCIKCHTVYGLGGAGGPDLGKVQAAWSFLDTAGVLWNHQPKMEAEFRRRKISRPSLTSEETFQLIAFVYFLNYFGSPGDAIEGEFAYLRKQCVKCHSVGSHGPPEGIPLDRFQSYRSPAFFAAALWNSSKDMTQMMVDEGVPRPVYEADDIVDILAFIRREADPQERVDPVYLPPGSSKKGQALFEEKGCVHCHSVGGEGGQTGPALGSWKAGGILSQIAGTMWNHGPIMWESMLEEEIEFPELSEEEMSDLMTYLYFSSFIDPPGDPVRGGEHFRDKGCVRCHEPDLAKDLLGTRVGMNVSQMKLQTSSEVVAAMWNHASEMDEATRSSNIAWPQFRPGQMVDLVAFIQSRSNGSTTP